MRATLSAGQVVAGPMPNVTASATCPPPPTPHHRRSPRPPSICPRPWPAGAPSTLTVELQAPDCTLDSTLPQFDLLLTYRTQSGRRVARALPIIGVQELGLCLAPLPTGPQPADPAAAAEAVRSAVHLVYDPSAGTARGETIDDPRGLDVAEADLQAGPNAAETAAATTVTVGDVSFDRPDHAWFQYELSAVVQVRTGQAVLVDGTWKVTRATVCADYALADVTCPPLPG